MKINLKFAELHNCLFLAGTNLQMKLDPSKRPLQLVYDRDEKELLVYFNNEVAIVPSSNVSSMTPINPADVGHAVITSAQPVPCAPTTKPNLSRAANGAPALGVTAQQVNPKAMKIQAQVQDPTRDAVFSNGPGKVRD